MRVINIGKIEYIGCAIRCPVNKIIEVSDAEGERLIHTFFDKNGDICIVPVIDLEKKVKQETVIVNTTDKLSEMCNIEFTVLMPVYNGEKYIEYALESILNSTYKNFNILIFDDGSNDNTLNIIKKFSEKNKNIKILGDGENHGVGFARNILIQECITKIAVWADVDDVVHKSKFELQLAKILKLEESGSLKNLVAVNWAGFKDNDETLKFLSENPERLDKLSYLQINSVMFEVNKDIKIADGIGYFNWGEDRDWKNKMVDIGYKINHVPYILQMYRTAPDGLTAQFRNNKLKLLKDS